MTRRGTYQSGARIHGPSIAQPAEGRDRAAPSAVERVDKPRPWLGATPWLRCTATSAPRRRRTHDAATSTHGGRRRTADVDARRRRRTATTSQRRRNGDDGDDDFMATTTGGTSAGPHTAVRHHVPTDGATSSVLSCRREAPSTAAPARLYFRDRPK